MHALLEYLPLIIFFIVWKLAGIYWATASLIVTSAIQIGYYIIKKQPVPNRLWVFFALIVVFGGLTIFFQNDLFLKWKVTIINGIFAVALVVSNSIFKKNLIKQLMGEALSLPEKVWAKLNLAWAAFFTVCALLNLYVAYNFSQETWVNFKVFGLMGLTFVFAISSVIAIHKYLPEEETKEDNAK